MNEEQPLLEEATDDDEEILAAEEDNEIMALQANIDMSYESIERYRDEIKERAEEFFKENGIEIKFKVSDYGHLERVNDYEAVVELQSFVIPLPRETDPTNPDNLKEIQKLVNEMIKTKAKNGEIHLDQYFIERVDK